MVSLGIGKLAPIFLQWPFEGRLVMVRVKAALTHEEMAQLTGSSRETVTRTLSEFKGKWIAELRGSTLPIRNRFALEQLAESV